MYIRRNKLQKVIKKGGGNEENNYNKSMRKKCRKTEVPPTHGAGGGSVPEVPGGIQVNTIENDLSEEKQK